MYKHNLFNMYERDTIIYTSKVIVSDTHVQTAKQMNNDSSKACICKKSEHYKLVKMYITCIIYKHNLFNMHVK